MYINWCRLGNQGVDYCSSVNDKNSVKNWANSFMSNKWNEKWDKMELLVAISTIVQVKAHINENDTLSRGLLEEKKLIN